MTLDTAGVKTHLQAGTLAKLFTQELGWDKHAAALPVAVGGHTFALAALAEKRGVVVYECPPDAGGRIPDYATRRAIEKAVTKAAFEHLLVFVDRDKATQVWQWVARGPGQPAAYREVRWHRGQSGDALVQKLAAITIPLSDEEALDLTGTVTRLRDAFDRDKVTKKFFDQFKAEHARFLDFLAGIDGVKDREWYASLMLNRLMFVYFIQKKGFLDGDIHYLRTKLDAVKAKKGKGKFHTFYRVFLRALFHDGFGTAKAARKSEAELAKLLGEVPYLNGGLFEVHQLEADNPAIEIPDEAFDRLFAFFDKWEWELDSRPLAAGNEINPDVLGYIFEKYINQKQMGAYYTKEDITDYIGKNTLIPRLFDMARERCEIAFAPGSVVWKLLADNPDRYLYPAVKTGVLDADGNVLPLPAEIEVGIADVSRRGKWNRAAPEPFALPTETWREHVARRQRCLDLRAKLRAGEIASVNDLITFNLDIRLFAQHAVETCEGPDLLRAFYAAVTSVTVLDPTCGSGAFLFAALNILQPLYDACLVRMANFVADADALGKPAPKTFDDFRATLTDADSHPSREYFVLKSVVVRNLYGVDLMPEAVEICKLRLFLKLVAQVDRADQLEPLPDIDFNIRPGNTLVGFATLADVRKAWAGTIDFDGEVDAIEKTATALARRFKLFRDYQTSLQSGGVAVNVTKDELRVGLADLRWQLDCGLAKLYQIEPDDTVKFDAWRASHQPFHWFAEFHAILSAGGFDVVIGNPPYVASSKARKEYDVLYFKTAKCTDVYSWVVERTCNITKADAYSGLILPLSVGFSDGFVALRSLLFGRYSANWFSSFGRIPSALFDAEVRVRNTIHIGTNAGTRANWSTRLHRWFQAERPTLFPTLSYAAFEPSSWSGRVPKLGDQKLLDMFEQLNRTFGGAVGKATGNGPESRSLYFKKTAYNWLTFCNTLPPCYDTNGGSIPHTKFGEVQFPQAESRDFHYLALNTKYQFAFWVAVGDDFDLTRWMFTELPLTAAKLTPTDRLFVRSTAARLEEAMASATSFKLNAGKRVGNYNLALCRNVTDDVDRWLLARLGFAEAWENLELLYAQTVKTDFGLEDSDEHES